MVEMIKVDRRGFDQLSKYYLTALTVNKHRKIIISKSRKQINDE